MLDKFTAKQFLSTKIQQNTHFPHLFTGSDNQYIGTISPHSSNKGKPHQTKHGQNEQLKPAQSPHDICDLQDLWNTIQQQKSVLKVKKAEIVSIFDGPETLTLEQMEQIFGDQQKNNNTLTQAAQISQKNEEAQDLGDLWDMVDSEETKQNAQKDLVRRQQAEKKQPQKKNQSPKLQQSKQADIMFKTQQNTQLKFKDLTLKKQFSKQISQSKNHQQLKPQKLQFYEVQEKQIQSEGRVCLTLGKDFAIYDYANFMTSCFSTSVYCYFGFKKIEKEQYFFYDLTTNQPLMVCNLQKYEQFIQNPGQQRKIQYQKNYCLKIRVANTDETIATIWQKTIANGLLYNIRHYNSYERKHDESVALIEITDSYIGNNCYCNTNVFISQKFSTQSGQLKMKLSLKNGYLIANMGVSGIKSAPYNCRLQNPNNSFVYLLGLLIKEQQKFIVRVGQGISPVIAFATSIGRKRYIDSFKD